MFKLSADSLDQGYQAILHHGYSDFFPEPPEFEAVKKGWDKLRTIPGGMLPCRRLLTTSDGKRENRRQNLGVQARRERRALLTPLLAHWLRTQLGLSRGEPGRGCSTFGVAVHCPVNSPGLAPRPSRDSCERKIEIEGF